MEVEIELAKRQLRSVGDPPRLTFNLGSSYSSSIQEGKSFEDGTNITAGISASYDLWNLFVMVTDKDGDNGEMEGFTLAFEKVRLDRDGKRREIASQVKKTYSALRNSIFKLELRREALVESREEYTITKEAFRRGAGDAREVKIDREAYLRGMEAFLDAITDYQTLLAEWERVVGV